MNPNANFACFATIPAKESGLFISAGFVAQLITLIENGSHKR
jgi:hypothetical protein